jgi:hypothetical protein
MPIRIKIRAVQRGRPQGSPQRGVGCVALMALGRGLSPPSMRATTRVAPTRGLRRSASPAVRAFAIGVLFHVHRQGEVRLYLRP